MDKELDFILDRINTTEAQRTRYIRAAERWERMWELDPGFGESIQQALRQGREQVVLATPLNTVNLAQRLLSTRPDIDVPPADANSKESVEYAQTCEKWLEGMWDRVNHQKRHNVIARGTLHALVLGKYAFEVKYVDNKRSKTLPHLHFPIHIRALDPRDVGIHEGDLYPEYVYHRYETTVLNVLQRYPDFAETTRNQKILQLFNPPSNRDDYIEDDRVVVTDYWFVAEDGDYIGNAILIDDEFAIEPWETDYPNLPIVVGTGDFSGGLGDDLGGLSILHGMEDTWEYECRLVSQMATGIMEYFWPPTLISNEFGEPLDNIEIGPGMLTVVPWGTKYEQHRPDVNTPLANTLFEIVDSSIQQASFPGVMYGESPGQLQAGFGVSLLADAAKGRIKNFMEGLEMGITQVHSLVLAIVEKMAPKEGIPVWGRVAGTRETYRVTLDKTMIGGHYENLVRLSPEVPAEQMQRITLGIRLAEGERPLISRQTLQDNYLGKSVPSDEEDRIMYEQAMWSDELRPYRLRKAIQRYHKNPDDTGRPEWYSILENTPLMPQDGAGGPEGQAPNGMPPQGMPPQGMPPVQPPQAAIPPQGGGIPPQMQGQITPESIGMGLRENPLLFQEVMNRPLPPEEELEQLGGIAPPY